MSQICIQCKKEFKIIPQEQEFYDKMGLPKPDRCPFCRQKLREAQRNERKFYKYPCAKCGQEMVTTHNPKKGLTVYCLKCYAHFRSDVDLTK
ncbi:zinc-ribbon domain containing protein [Candidatus Roizmanbacteria bacterium]|nr:zinc-ribbon domain containing protein [Candidatus Roizmanbacteria bacterium]